MVLGKIRENVFLLFALALTVLAVLPLFHAGFFPVHDNEQIGRLFELDQALKAGQFPVRIIQDLGFGYGYLLFNFYPPFIYYLGEIFHLLQFSFIDSTKIVIGLGFFLSAFFMYLFAKEYFGKVGGMVAAVFYIFAPYHSVDVYVRGALPEFFSFALIPAIFWLYLRLSKTGEKKYVLAASLFSFVLVITHNLVAMMALPFIGAYIIFLLWQNKEPKRFLLQTIVSGLFSFLLSSFFIIPALLENKFTMVSLLTNQLADYHLHYVYIRQFFNSAWGYGGSVYGLGSGLSFEVGKVHLFAVLLSGLAFIFSAIKKKINYTVLFFLVLFLFSLFMQSFHSTFVWDRIAPMSYIQFPWRFLLFSVFTSSFLAGYVVNLLKGEKQKILIGVLVSIIVAAVNFNFFQPQKYLAKTDKDYTDEKFLKWDTSQMAFEYVPRGISMKISSIGNSIVNISQSEIAVSPYKVLTGKMDVQVEKNSSSRKVIKLNVSKEGIFQLNQFYYPGWKVFVDGKETKINDNNRLKVITFYVASGSHIINAKFENTQIRSIANLLTLAGIIAIFVYSLNFKKYYAKN